MIIKDKIVVKNYKCFDSSGGGFEKIFPINIIIGKNNSGKSSLIDLIQFVVKPDNDFALRGRDNSKPEVLITHNLTESEISSIFHSNSGGGGIPGNNHFEYGKRFIDKLYTYQIDENGRKFFKNISAEYVPQARTPIDGLVNSIQNPFIYKIFCKITAERDVIPEVSNAEIILSPNGTGATNYIQQIINRTNRDSRLIEIELLKELNSIINPDIKFTRIFVQLNDNSYWELFFEDFNNKRIPLSKMGSGVKTVLLVLLNLIVRPVIENKTKDSYIFAFEELENNLHPSLQRRLYNYIIKYSESNSSYFFLTTHSNVVIDAFGTNINTQLVHVTNNGDISTSNTILTYNGTKQILSDLGIKASDLLQSNGVIWVEGPSDRNYINKWLEILSPQLKEGLHYSIMFYGGRLLANLSFDYDWFNTDVIPLLKINKNAFVVIDRDGKTINVKLNNTKIRINQEIGDNNCWITNGREIENYLSDKIVSNWLFEKHHYKSKFTNDKNIKLEDNILNSNDKIKLKYNLSKTLYSSEISEYIDRDSMNLLDLITNLDSLIKRILEWNR
jgi:predicted ATP-dependent endonuclease of OLD family